MTVETAHGHFAAGTLLVCVLVGAAAQVHGVQEAAATPESHPTAEAALAAVVAEDGAPYAGDCAATRSPADVGKVCTRFVAERAGLRAYLSGRTFAEFDTWVFVAGSGGGWQRVGTAPLNFFSDALNVPWP